MSAELRWFTVSVRAKRCRCVDSRSLMRRYGKSFFFYSIRNRTILVRVIRDVFTNCNRLFCQFRRGSFGWRKKLSPGGEHGSGKEKHHVWCMVGPHLYVAACFYWSNDIYHMPKHLSFLPFGRPEVSQGLQSLVEIICIFARSSMRTIFINVNVNLVRI